MADLIAAEKDHLISCWRARVQGTVDPHAPKPEIIDSLPAFIDELIDVLRGQRTVEAGDPNARTNGVAVIHGSQRFHAGFSLGAVIAEYGVLRDCMLDLIRAGQVPISLDELATILKMLSSAVVSAAEQFVHERDQAIERQSHQHFGFIAHELRNPLGSAILAAQALQSNAGAHSEVIIQRLLRNLGTLRHLIDNTLASVRIDELGRSGVIDKVGLGLREIVESIRDELAGDAAEKAITIVPQGDASVEADPRLVRSAATNLLRNAIKFTRPGGRIDVRIRAGEGRASVEVEDECGGLPEGKAEELFTPFVQRGADRSGFGLGLAITKHAAEAHHGTVQVSNLPGKGCIFMLSLPSRRT